jgi:uncharacterized protein YdaU (DUF1376 family)
MPKDYIQWRKHHVREWAMDPTVRQMSFAAQGIYHALIDLQWESGSIPADPQTCARILRCTEEEWAQFAPFFEECFPLNEDGGRSNEQTQLNREEAKEQIEASIRGGKASGEARRKKRDAQQKSVENEDPSKTLQGPFEDPGNPTDKATDKATDNSVTNVTGADGQAAAADDLGGDDFEEREDPPALIFQTVKRILQATARGKPVRDSKVRRYLAKDSPILELLEQYGETDAKRLLLWATTHKALSPAVISRNSESLWAEAERYKWEAPPERGKKPGWGDPAEDIRKMTEDLLGPFDGIPEPQENFFPHSIKAEASS